MFGPMVIPCACAATKPITGVICSICIGLVSQWCGNHSDLNPASRATCTCVTISGTRSATFVPSGNWVLMNSPTFISGFSHFY